MWVGQSSTAKAIPDATGAAAATGPTLTAAEANDKYLDHNQERCVHTVIRWIILSAYV